MKSTPVNLDDMLTVQQFAEWQQISTRTVSSMLPSMKGVVRKSRKNVRIHVRTYLHSCKCVTQ